MRAMILCAGLGTRLRPLTLERPKPLVPVLGRPLAAWALDRVVDAGATHVVANAHHLHDQVEPALRPWAERRGVGLTVLHEPTLLGTGGAIRNALPSLGGDDFVVFNGDVLAAPALARALAHHRATGAAMTLVLRDDPRAERLGAIEVTEDGRVLRILGEGPAPREPVRPCVFTGIYVVSPRVAEHLPAEGCVVRHTLRRLLAGAGAVSGVIDHGPWFDLGTPETYVGVQLDALAGRFSLPGFTPPAVGALRGAGVVLGQGVKVVGSVLGDGSRVEGEGELSRSIVWDGAVAQAPLSDAVVTRRGVLTLEAASGQHRAHESHGES